MKARDAAIGRFKKSLGAALPDSAKSFLKRSILKSEVTAAVKPKVLRALVTVVIPVYNVEDHVEEALCSVLAQTHDNLQIIVVDDGSTDKSLSIVQKIAASDNRVEVIAQKNAGLGAARNAGTAQARGKYIAFADSDDVVPRGAYRVMVDTLEESGSDFVTGSYLRFNSNVRREPVWMQREHAQRRLRIHIEEYRDGLVNVFAWNKLYRLSVWKQLGMSFTEGVRYEDQEPMTRLMVLAKGFDIIPDVVYWYRLREDESSITQNKHLLKDVQDRSRVIRLAGATLEEFGSLASHRAWISKLIRFDLIAYIREAADAGAEYQSEVQSLLRYVRSHSDVSVVEDSPVKNRFLIAIALGGHWDSLGEALLWSDSEGSYFETICGLDGSRNLKTPFADLVESSDFEFGLKLGRRDIELVPVLTWASLESGQVRVAGWAILKNIDDGSRRPGSRIDVTAVSDAGRVRIPMRVETTTSSDASAWARSKNRDLSDVGFTAVADLDVLRASGSASHRWHFEVRRSEVEGIWEAPLTRRASGFGGALLDSGFVDDGMDWQWRSSREAGIELRGARNVPEVNICTREGRMILTLATTGKRAPKRVRLTSGKDSLTLDLELTELGVEASVALSDLGSLDFHRSWLMRVSGLEEATDGFRLPAGSGRLWYSRELGLRRDEAGRVRVEVLPQALSVLDLVGGTSGLQLIGSAVHPSLVGRIRSIRISGDLGLSEAAQVNWDGGVFGVSVPTRDETGAVLPDGGYSIKAFDSDGNEYAVLASPSIDRVVGQGYLTNSHRIVISKTRYGNAYAKLGSPVPNSDFGSYCQRQLQNLFRIDTSAVEQNKAIFHAYLGEQSTDSSKALSQYLLDNRPEIDVVWATKSPAVSVPDGARQVTINSRRWYRELATAGVIVHNIYFDPWFKVREGQRFIQTWHGTPLKTINHSYWKGIGRKRAWIERMDAQAEQWTYLLSPSPYYSSIVAPESGFKGELLELGYPRNDKLFPSSASAQKRLEVRQLFGIRDDQYAVLYAPTWRDSLSSRSWTAERVDYLNPGEFASSLGEDFVFMFRGHGHNARAGAAENFDSGALDVTHYSDINDLYLAADVIVSDYSSVMFDAVVAQKPLVFFTPDLAEYEASPRGVYLDIREVAPGPLLQTESALVSLLRSLSWTSLPGTEDYQIFKETYAPYEDGQASARVSRAVWPQSEEE